MKKVMLLAALLALVVVAASPAYAQGSGSSIEVEEGDVEISDTTTVEGSIVQNCPASVTFGDNNENVQVISGSQNAVIDIDGDENEAEIEQELVQSGFSPEVSTKCTQEIAQAAAAGGGEAKAEAGKAKAEAKAGEEKKAEAKAGGAKAEAKAAPAPKAEAKAGGAEAKAAPAPKAEAKAAPAPKAEAKKAELPKTGGGASLFALGAGALLVGAGLVARRIVK